MRFLDGAYYYFKKQPLYCLLKFCAVLIGFGCALTALNVSFLVLEWFGFKSDSFGELFAMWFCYLGIWIPGLFLSIRLAVLLFNYAGRFKFRYTDTAEAIYEEPTLWDYDISEKEFTSYMSRFQFGHLLVALGFVVTMLAVISLDKKESIGKLLLLLIPLLVPLAIHIVILMLNAALDRRYPQHHKVERYLEAKRIYQKVLEEL